MEAELYAGEALLASQAVAARAEAVEAQLLSQTALLRNAAAHEREKGLAVEALERAQEQIAALDSEVCPSVAPPPARDGGHSSWRASPISALVDGYAVCQGIEASSRRDSCIGRRQAI